MSALLKVKTALTPGRVVPQFKLRARSDDDRLSPGAQTHRTLADDVALGMMVACCALFAAACALYGFYPVIQSLAL